jgi:hypothetical protein
MTIPTREVSVRLHTMYGAERRASLPSTTNDGGEILVPYLAWHPGASSYPCEAELLDPKAQDNTTRIRCGKPAGDTVHEELELAPRHDYLATRPQPGMYLVLDGRLGYTIPSTIDPDQAADLIEFVANAIAIGAGYASIYYTKRKMPFRG